MHACSPIPVGTVPIYEALERANGQIEGVTWEMFRQVMIDQAEQVRAGTSRTLLTCLLIITSFT